MANVTERFSAADYLALLGNSKAPMAKRGAKYGNTKSVSPTGEKYDSSKELKQHRALDLARTAVDPAQRVVEIRRQVPYLLLEKQEGERAIQYFADFVVRYADGRVEVQDTKSPPTRAISTYIMKRKMLLRFHGIRIVEI